MEEEDVINKTKLFHLSNYTLELFAKSILCPQTIFHSSANEWQDFYYAGGCRGGTGGWLTPTEFLFKYVFIYKIVFKFR